MTAFVLNVFGKNDSQDFRMILSCHHLEPQAAIPGLTNEANNIYNFLNHFFFFLILCLQVKRETYIQYRYLIDNLIEIKKI